MKIKKFLFCMFLILCVFSFSIVEAASPDSFTVQKSGSINETGLILRGGDIPAHFTYKYANVNGTNYIVLCTGYRGANIYNFSFRKDNSWSAPVRAGIAAIIKDGIGDNATTSSIPNDEQSLKTGAKKLYFTQVSLWKYIQDELRIDQDLVYTLGLLNEDQADLVNKHISAGEAAKARYNVINSFSISTSSKKLTFTLKGDEYISNMITVSGKELRTSDATVNKGTVTKNGHSYIVKVPKSELSNGKTTITLNITANSNSIYVASNYSNGESGQQTTTISLFDSFSKTDSASISGSIDVSPNRVTISKQEATTGNELPGATLILKDESGNEKLRWISTNEPKVIENLAPGKYILTELIAPDGYIKSSETVTFTVNSQGVVEGGPVVMKNEPKGPITISKQDATTGREVPGATLVLKNASGKEIDKWVSGSTPHSVGVLEAGKYTLIETIAPVGYEKTSEVVTFTVKEDGTVASPVVMKNKPKEVIVNPKTGLSVFGISIFIAFVSFAVSFYFYADYKVKANM